MFLYGLDINTGEVLHQKHLVGPYRDLSTDPGAGYWMDGAKSDLLVSDGTSFT